MSNFYKKIVRKTGELNYFTYDEFKLYLITIGLLGWP